MAKETALEQPPEGHIGIWAYDSVNDRWQAVYVDASGNLQVGVVASGLPTGAATAANQATIIAAMLNRAATPDVHNVTMTSADTEYSQALSANTKKFMIKCRGNYDIKLAFASGESGTAYINIPSGGNYWDDMIQPTSITLYFQCATAAQVAEIVEWA